MAMTAQGLTEFSLRQAIVLIGTYQQGHRLPFSPPPSSPAQASVSMDKAYFALPLLLVIAMVSHFVLDACLPRLLPGCLCSNHDDE